MSLRKKVIERKINRIIIANDYLDNSYVRSHLRYVIQNQKWLKKLFRLPLGIWEYFNTDDEIQFWRIDGRKNQIIIMEI